MKYWLYRWFMSFAHRHGWHKMDEFHPDGDTLLWCQWCGLRVVTKRRLTKRAVDFAPAVRSNCTVCGGLLPKHNLPCKVAQSH